MKYALIEPHILVRPIACNISAESIWTHITGAGIMDTAFIAADEASAKAYARALAGTLRQVANEIEFQAFVRQERS